jgi:Permuted papain-like amidase enzyme, YaeF/YiiX, C92 family
MKNSRIYFSLVSLFLTSFSCGEPSPTALLREGDIVFNSSPQGAGEAIMAATGSKFTHCGLVFSDKGRLMVIEAVQPVRVVSLETFQTHSPAGTFTVRRLRKPLAEAAFAKAKEWGKSQIGKHYDTLYLWDDRNLYCSELVWKAYQHAGLELCQPKRFRDLNLEKPSVQKIITERFGGMEHLPLDEKIVAPSDLANSPQMEEVIIL